MTNLRATWDAVSFPVAAGRAQEAARVLDGWASTRRRNRRRYGLAATGLAAAAALLFAFSQNRTPLVPAASLSSEAFAVRPNIEMLPDGSTAELNSGAEIAVHFTPEKRAVQLLRGEALFSVTKNAARPFVVSAGGIEVRAVGTAFSVRFDPQQVGVLVTDGRVAIEQVKRVDASPGESISQPIYLSAGGQVAMAIDRSDTVAPAVSPLTPQQISTALAWRGKRVEFSRMPLDGVVNLLNRQNKVQLAIADQSTRNMPISGIFWSDDPEGFARLLESGLGVHAERSGNIISLSNR